MTTTTSLPRVPNLIEKLCYGLTASELEALQDYAGQILLGKNHSRRILVITGEPGAGKSLLMQIFTACAGIDKVDDRAPEAAFLSKFYLAEVAGKSTLVFDDGGMRFLRRNLEALRMLCGGGRLDYERKGDPRSLQLEANFNVVVIANPGAVPAQIKREADVVTVTLTGARATMAARAWSMGGREEQIGEVFAWMTEGAARVAEKFNK